jgi:putative zinc finger protein
MCEFSERLVAWLDDELAEGETAEMERHLAGCAQCRGRLAAYRQASDAFESYSNAYGDIALSARPGRRSVRPARAIYGAAAIAAIVVAFFLLTARTRRSQEHTRVEIGSAAGVSQPVQTAQEETARQSAAVAPLTAAGREKSKGAAYMSHAAPDRRLEAQHPEEKTDSLPGAPAVEIAIPADAIFPPGAVPPGVDFTADVTMASDGSAQQIRLRPQLTEFQRRGTQR